MALRLCEKPSEEIGQGEWLIHIKQGLQHRQCISRPSTVCIFTVPKILVDLKRDAYLPQAVSIGPCYQRAMDLHGMEIHKLRVAQIMIKRLPGKTDINSMVAEIEKMDGQIRDKYVKIIQCDSETLAWMMLLDSSFLLELLRTLAGKDQSDSCDNMYFEPLFDENRIKSVGFAVLKDIVKLENQIPLLVLDKILQLETGSEKEAQAKLFDLLLNATSSFFPFKYLQLSGFELDSSFISREHYCGLVGNKRIDRIIQLVAGNELTGINIAWWKRNHNAHHIACNSLEFDLDLQYIPLFAVSSRFFCSLYSYFYDRKMSFDGVARVLISYQHWTFYPVMAIARINLFGQSIILLLSKNKIPDRAKEIIGIVAFWVWFPLLISCLPTWSERAAFVLSSFIVTGVQHVQFCLNHFSSSVYVGRPCSKSWFESQTRGTLDILCSPWLD